MNDRIEATYRREHRTRRKTIEAREGDMTAVYNFYALPPARANFCRSMLEMANRYLAAPPSDALAFALANFSSVEAPFDAFFSSYEDYERSSAEWDAKYGARYGASQPGWLAVQRARAEGRIPRANLVAPAAANGAVTDADTGAEIPVVPVNEGFVSQPVVEPIPTEPGTEEPPETVGPVDGPG